MGFGDSSYVILRRIRSISCFACLFVLLSCVECAPTCSQNLVFLRSLSCHVYDKILICLIVAKHVWPPPDRSSKFNGLITNLIANNVSFDDFNWMGAFFRWFFTLLTWLLIIVNNCYGLMLPTRPSWIPKRLHVTSKRIVLKTNS